MRMVYCDSYSKIEASKAGASLETLRGTEICLCLK